MSATSNLFFARQRTHKYGSSVRKQIENPAAANVSLSKDRY